MRADRAAIRERWTSLRETATVTWKYAIAQDAIADIDALLAALEAAEQGLERVVEAAREYMAAYDAGYDLDADDWPLTQQRKDWAAKTLRAALGEH